MSGFRRPESVLVIVYTDDLKILLLKRNEPFEFWQSVTGSLEDGESPADAAVREIAEETGLASGDRLADAGRQRVFQIDPRWLDRYAPRINENLEYEWHYRLDAPVDVQVNPAEHDEWAWVTIDEAIERVWSWTNREALEALRSVATP
ncbi:MAG: dihydroneopterin triphosphate diphosphatase [Woeseiaceae bacterium]|nr:dihydroneopterin triphosphate diphosphatase [Woeseiaceae bacterium]